MAVISTGLLAVANEGNSSASFANVEGANSGSSRPMSSLTSMAYVLAAPNRHERNPVRTRQRTFNQHAGRIDKFVERIDEQHSLSRENGPA